MPSNVKARKFKKFLKWLDNNKGVEVSEGKHFNVKAIHNGNKFPIPCSHGEVNRFIINEFLKWLERNKVCSRKEAVKKLKR